ncbi:putative reverse transcriptase domain-containing protein [Tanacetum coccineum]
MTTRSAGRPAAASRGRGTGRRVGRSGGRTGGRSGDQGKGRIDGQGGQGDQGRDQGNGRNQNGDAINDNIRGDVRNLIENNDRRGCTYKEFLACNPKEYDRKGVKYTVGSFVSKALTWWNSHIRTLGREAAVGMSWDNFKVLMREEFCPSNEMQKLETELWDHAMVGAGHAAYTDRFHELARLIRGMVAAMKPSTIQKVVQIAGTLTNEALRNGSIKKNHEKIGNGGEPSKDMNGRDDNKRTKTGHFAKDCRVVPRNVNPINARNPTARACYQCGRTDHIKASCPRLNQAQRPGGNHQNQVVAVNGGQGRGNNSNQAHGRAFMLGAEEARQDSNIMTGMFTLNNPYATTLFDSGADYSFVSTTFIPLLGIEPSDLRFSYEIEIVSGQLVEIDKVVKGCKLEIEDHVFDINLIPFRSGSFDVIIGMDWLANHKAEIICHEKVV